MAQQGVGVQSIEEFWGAELSKKTKKITWPKEDDDVEDDLEKTLELRQACVGRKAKEGERNMVQITTEDEDGDEVSHTILSLRAGGTEQCSLFLTLQPSVTFELIEGNGPVHIVGVMNQALLPFLDSDESSGEEEELSSPEVKVNGKKRPATSPPQKPAKALKLSKKGQESDEVSDEEESMALDSSIDAKKGKGKKEEEEAADSEEDSDDEDEDDSEEEESDEEESEEDEKPPAKKAQAQKNKPLAKTPQPTKSALKSIMAKGSQSAPTTPKGAQGGDKKPQKAPLSIDEVKQKLLKLPALPKKLDKFSNFVGNSFKITSEDVKKQLWEFVQKNRPQK